MSGQGRPPAPQQANVHHRRFSFVWLIPILAGVLAIYLGFRTLEQRGPLITITFKSGDGLTADQTQVKYKAVQLGTLESVRLSEDMTHVVVRVRMRSEAAARLTDHARFWVVRPRFSSGNISGLETLVSGAYIAMDPGEPGGKSERDYTGLENPPGRRSDEPGTTYTLQADSIGSLGEGSPVFYRDISVGEVLGYDQPGLNGKIVVHVFVRAPYDRYVRNDTRFWNTSGVQVNVGAGGIHVQLESLQAVLSGGVAFSTPPDARGEASAKQDTTFELFKDQDSAVSATSKDRILMVTYFTGSVRGLSAGSNVEYDGIRVGTVTDMRLEYDAATHDFRVPVHLAVEPETVALVGGTGQKMRDVLTDFVQRGLHASLETSSYLTGSLVVELKIPPGAKPAPIQMQGDEIVLPGDVGGFGGIVTSLGDIAARLDKVPFDQIGNNLNGTLASLNGLVGSPEVKDAVRDLSSTLASIRDLVRKADTGITPVLKQLPQMEADLQGTLKHANEALGSVSSGYGRDSEFNRDLSRLMDQANDTLRSVRALTDFLSRHPEALIRGRAGEAASR